MASPAAIQICIQQDEGDCALAAISMMTGIPYRQVSDTARQMFTRPHKTGLWTRDIVRLLKRLGHATETVAAEKAELGEETGLLVVQTGRAKYHVVALFEGVVINPYDGLVYALGAYLGPRVRALKLLRV